MCPHASRAPKRADVNRIVAELVGRDEELLLPEHRLVDDLDMDSMEILDLAIALEDAFELDRIADETVEKWATLEDIYRYLGAES